MKLKIVTVCENKINKENSELKRAIIKASEELGVGALKRWRWTELGRGKTRRLR